MPHPYPTSSTHGFADLYGNDETDFTENLDDQPQDTTASDAESSTPTTATIDTKVSSNGATTSESNGTAYSSTTTSYQTQTKSTPVTSSATSSIPTYSSSTPPSQPQKIPTYEQPIPSSGGSSIIRPESAGLQKIPVNERSVRPSEMKDEG